MLSIGPFPVSAAVLALALAIAYFVARVAGRKAAHRVGHMADATGTARLAGALVFDMALIGLLAARVVFVLQWLPEYLADPWSIVRIGDGGFTVWAGVLSGLGWAAWRVRKAPMLHRPLLTGAIAGLLCWGFLAGALLLMQRSTVSLPDTQLSTLDGRSTTLHALSGKPKVLNLWATWCPPCRREMPVLADAQQRNGGVDFMFVNQGEGPDTVRDYLRDEGIVLDNVLLDPFSSVMHGVGSRGLPTTLFFDGNGKLVDTHMGELSEASLAQKLQVLAASPTSSPTHSQELP